MAAAIAATALAFGAAPAWGQVADTVLSQIAQPFSPDEQFWLEATLDDRPLTDALDAYAGRGSVYLPLGALSRLLDLAITVLPPERRAEGWVIREDRLVVVDLRRGLALANGREFALSPGDAVFFEDEVWVTPALLQRLLPVSAQADTAAQTLVLRAREPLPAQQRQARDGARSGLSVTGGEAAARRVETPYELFTAPSVDVSIDTGLANRSPQESFRYDLRLGGDLAYGGFQLFAGSDDGGALSTVRALLERKDPDGRRAGPFGATRAGIGDVFTPSLALGARSTEGRGVFAGSGPIEQLSAFTRLDLRGELPLGYEVELYVNEVLRGSQASPVEGRYEFQDVALSYGLNILRLVFYGPRGERREEVRRVNFGTSQLARGQAVWRFGLVEQGMPLFDVREDVDDDLFQQPGEGQARFVGSVDFGLTSRLTVSVGAAHFTPSSGEALTVGTLGLRTSLAGLAVQADGAIDDRGGGAFALGVAGRARGAGYIVRHAEYGGGFVDELQPRGAFFAQPLARATDLFLDGQVAIPKLGLVPISAELHVNGRVDGSSFVLAEARASTTFDRFFASASIGYERDSALPGDDGRMSGGVDVSTVVHRDWQVRAGVAYEAVPDLRLSSTFVAVDRAVADRLAVRAAVTHSFGDGVGDTVLQGSAIWRLPAADLALTLGYATREGDARIGLQLAFGFAFDPGRGRYRGVRPGVAAGGAVAFQSYVDADGDGRRGADERPVPGLILQGGPIEATTDERGRVLATGLGDGAFARLRVEPESVTDPYLSAEAETFEFVPRPGRVTVIDSPLRVTGEAEIRLLLRRGDAEPIGLSAVQVQVLDASGRVAAEGRSEYDGTVLIERLPPGRYALRLRPEQAERLRLRLAAPTTIEIGAGGGFVGGLTATLEPIP